MNKISLVIITFNEEKNINRCISSAEEVVDEIIVIDSFSTDRTKEICMSMNVNFIEKKFEGYTAQKNFAVAKASYDFILSLDADESLSPVLLESMRQVKKNGLSGVYEMNRLTNYCGKWIKHTDWYPDKKIRLFDKNLARWGGINLHETVIIDKDINPTFLKGDILHYSYSSIGQHINQFNFFTDIGAREALLKGKEGSLFKIIFNPGWKFFQSYIIRLGFLDGYYGFLVCAISAFATFAKYIKLRELQKDNLIGKNNH